MPGPFDRISGAIGQVGSRLGLGGSPQSGDSAQAESRAESEREETATPDSSPEPKSSAEPEQQSEPEDDAEPKTSAPESSPQPELSSQPESSQEPESSPGPEQPAETTTDSPERPEHAAIRQDEGLPTAPSIGPHTHIEHVPPEERLAGHDYSDVDAMGLSKRRSVVGGTYGPTRTRIIATFATFFAVVAVLAIGFFLLAKELDQPPDSNPDEAPWSVPDAPQNAVPKLQ